MRRQLETNEKKDEGEKLMNEVTDEPTWRCHQNPFIGALGIQEPVIPGEPLIKEFFYFYLNWKVDRVLTNHWEETAAGFKQGKPKTALWLAFSFK